MLDRRAAGLRRRPVVRHRRRPDRVRAATRTPARATSSSPRPTRATARSCCSRPYGAIVTNVEADHLDNYGDLAAVDGASSTAFLGPDRPGRVPRRLRRRPRRRPARADVAARAAGCAPTGARRGRRPAADRPRRRRRRHAATRPVARRAATLGRVADPGARASTWRSTAPPPLLAGARARAAAPGRWSRASAGSAACTAGSSCKGVGRRRRASTTTTPTTRPRSPPSCGRPARSPAAAGCVVAFQPHLYSRTADVRRRGSARRSGLADEVVVMDVYGAREDPVPGVTGALVADAVPLPAGAGAVRAVLVGGGRRRWPRRARPGDLVLTMGAGDVTDGRPGGARRAGAARRGSRSGRRAGRGGRDPRRRPAARPPAAGPRGAADRVVAARRRARGAVRSRTRRARSAPGRDAGPAGRRGTVRVAGRRRRSGRARSGRARLERRTGRSGTARAATARAARPGRRPTVRARRRSGTRRLGDARRSGADRRPAAAGAARVARRGPRRRAALAAGAGPRTGAGRLAAALAAAVVLLVGVGRRHARAALRRGRSPTSTRASTVTGAGHRAGAGRPRRRGRRAGGPLVSVDTAGHRAAASRRSRASRPPVVRRAWPRRPSRCDVTERRRRWRCGRRRRPCSRSTARRHALPHSPPSRRPRCRGSHFSRRRRRRTRRPAAALAVLHDLPEPLRAQVATVAVAGVQVTLGLGATGARPLGRARTVPDKIAVSARSSRSPGASTTCPASTCPRMRPCRRLRGISSRRQCVRR